MNRRQFLIATAAAATTGCGSTVVATERVINAGSVSNYADEGVHDAFADEGFFVISKQGKLIVLSAICTHRTCKLKAEPDRTFYCKCHGSTFDPDGKVTIGPARRPLPILPSTINEHQELLVTIPAGLPVSGK